MITQFFPKDFQRYLALPVFGSMMDSYAAWLFEQQYTHRSGRYELRMAAHVCEFLKSRGLRSLEDVSEDDLTACYHYFQRQFPKEKGSVRLLTRFLMERTGLRPSPAPNPHSIRVRSASSAPSSADWRTASKVSSTATSDPQAGPLRGAGPAARIAGR